MPSTTLARAAATARATTGAGGLGVTAFAVFRLSSAHGLPGAAWVALAVAGAAAAALSALGLILEYRLRRLGIQAASRERQVAAGLDAARLEAHRMLLEEAAAQPEAAAGYSDLLIADALYLSVDRGGAFPAGQVPGQRPVPAAGQDRAVPQRCRGALRDR